MFTHFLENIFLPFTLLDRLLENHLDRPEFSGASHISNQMTVKYSMTFGLGQSIAGWDILA